MTPAELVRTRLLAMSAVTDLVSSRVYTQLFPQSVTFPAIRVQRIDEVDTPHLRGVLAMKRARVQVDAVAKTAAAAFALDAAAYGDGAGSGLAGWTGSLGSPAQSVFAILPLDARDDYQADELQQHRVMRDYIVTFED